jgi:hypothetical protein
MNGSQRANGKAVEVSKHSSIFLAVCDSMNSPETEDMFGIDDADWAIYRKIVSWRIFLTCILVNHVPMIRILQRSPLMKKMIGISSK